MAIAGGMTTAYLCRIIDGKLYPTSTTYPKALCKAPEDAAALIRSGKSVYVAGSDMVQLRKELEGVQA